MISFLRRLFASTRSIIIVDVEKHFGPRMDWLTLTATLRGRQSDPLYRAFGQLLAAQRELCLRAVADKSNLPAGQTAYEAGAVANAADVMGLLKELEAGQCRDSQISAYFGGQNSEELPPDV